MTEELEQRVRELEKRVAYLEQQLEMSVEEELFEREVRKVVPSGQDFEVDTGGMSYTATLSIVPADLPQIAKGVSESENLGWELKESSEDSITISIREGLHHA